MWRQAFLRAYGLEEIYVNIVRWNTQRVCVNNSWNNIGMLLRQWEARGPSVQIERFNHEQEEHLSC